MTTKKSSNDIFDKLNKIDEEKKRYAPKNPSKRINNRNENVKRATTKSEGSRRKHNDNFNYSQPLSSHKGPYELANKKNINNLKNGTFLFVTYLSVLLFLSLGAYMSYFYLIKADDFISSPYNRRQDLYSKQVIRGNIFDKDGNVLAETNVSEDGEEIRSYPYGATFAHVVGYVDSGKAGIEAKNNFQLLTSHANIIEQIKNDFENKKQKGDNIKTTLDTALQQTAAASLEGFKGAIVCMEPQTGKILAMYSNPTFEPSSVGTNWDELNFDEENSPLLDRSIKGLYPPGSTFKAITALEYMKENPNYNNFSFDCTGNITYGDTTISCYDDTIHGEEDLSTAFANSCNGAFATIAQNLDADKFNAFSNNLLFNTKLPGPFSAEKSRFILTSKSSMIDQMMTAFGQGDTMVSPYHLALITSAIANRGVLMQPYIVSEITNYRGSVIEKKSPKEFKRLLNETDASNVTELMKGVVQFGTASALSGYNYEVAAKTGTAEYSSDKNQSHSLFIGFSNPSDPDLAIAVVVEKADGLISATNIAGTLFEAYHNE